MTSFLAILKKLWPTKIRSRLVLGIVLVHVSLMSFFVFDLVRRQRQFLEQQNREQTLNFVSDYAVNAEPYMIANDFAGLQRLTQSHMNLPNLKYIMILSPEGIVLSHTNTKYIGTKPTDSISLKLKHEAFPQTLLENNYILDMAVPILADKKLIGWARGGVGQEYIYTNLSSIWEDGLMYIIFAVAAGIFCAVIIGSQLNKGLYGLISTAKQIRNGNRSVRAAPSDTTEISQLSTAFNEMLDEISVNEKILHQFVEHSPASLAMFDTNMRYLVTSLRWKNDYKLSDADIIGKTHYEVFPTIHQEWKDIHQRCLAGAIEKNEEDHFIREDGSIDWLKWEIHPWKKASGEIGGIIMFTEVITDKKKAAALILHEKNISETLINGLPGIFYVAKRDGRMIRWNKDLESISGYSSAEIANMKTIDFVSADQVPLIMEKRKEAFTIGKASSEVNFYTKDKQKLIYYITIMPIIYNNELSILGIGIDFTEKKQAELQLVHKNWEIKERVKELRCLYSLSELCNEKEFSVQDILEGCTRIIPTGYQYPEITRVYIDFDDLCYKSEGFAETPWKQEADIVIRGKHVGKVAVYYMEEKPDFDEGPFLTEERMMITSVTDILSNAIERKMSETELRESEEKFRGLVEQTLVGVFILQEGKFKYVNPRFAKMSGYSKEKLKTELTLDDLVQAVDLERVRNNLLNRPAGNNTPDHYVLKAFRSDGALLHVEVILSAITFDGKPAVIGTVIDITEQVEEEKRISKAVNDAQEMERVQISMELHDNVKQIMAASLMNIDYVRMNLKENEQATESLFRVKDYIIEAVEQLRKISHKLAPSVDAEISLEQKIKTLINNMNVVGKMDVHYNFDKFQKSIPDDVQLAVYRILQEQITNVLKYADASSVEISLTKQNGHLVMGVKDDGRGFDAKKKKPGIGLENIKRRARVLNGEMTINSSFGKGCDLVVKIPLEESVVSCE